MAFGNVNSQADTTGSVMAQLQAILGGVKKDPSFMEEGGGFGNVMTGFNALTGGVQAFTGLKQYSLGKKSFAHKQELDKTNLANSAQSYNTELMDRQAARLGANPNGYQSLATYGAENKVSGKLGG